MRLIISLFLACPLFATSSVTLEYATPTSLVYKLTTNQTGSCSMKLSEINNFGGGYAPVHDVDTTLFSGRDQCTRSWNLDRGTTKYLRFGFGTTLVSTSDNRRYSLALQANTKHYLQVVVGSDTVTETSASTTNLPDGSTYQQARFDRANPGQYDYPSWNWNDRTKSVIDPMTGVKITRASGPANIIPAALTTNFVNPLTQLSSGWTITGLGAVYSGTSQGWLYFRSVNPSYPASSTPSYAVLNVTLSGSEPSVDVCTTNDGVACSGNVVLQTITGSAVAYNIGSTTPILESWRSGPTPPSSAYDQRQLSGNVSVDSDRITVHWQSGDIFNPDWHTGSLITINGTDCAIQTIASEEVLTLQSSSCTVASAGTPYTANNYGFLLRAHTNASGTITVANTPPTWTLGVAGITASFSAGYPRQCQALNYNGPTGSGNLCGSGITFAQFGSGNVIYWFGQDGTVNPIGMSFVPVGATGLSNGSCIPGNGWAWDPAVAGKYWCIGSKAGVAVVYSVTYSGAATETVIPIDSNLPSSTAGDVSSGLTAMITAFNPAFSGFSSTCNDGWILDGIQDSDLILECRQPGQNYPGWWAVFNVSSKTITAATATFDGPNVSEKRWIGIHTTNLASNGYLQSTYNSLTVDYQSTTASALGPNSGGTAWTACPANSVDATIVGVSVCTSITLNTITPISVLQGISLFGQTWRIGDYALVFANGVMDLEMVRFITISGLNVVVQRNVKIAFVTHLLGTPNTTHTGSLALQTYPGAAGSEEVWWHYSADPTGADIADVNMPCGRSICADPNSMDCHQVFSAAAAVLGCVLPVTPLGVSRRTGALPANFTAPLLTFALDAGFAGTTYIPSSSYLESHPSVAVSLSSTLENSIGMDLRPYMGDPNIASVANTSKLGGFTFLYKIAAAGTVGLDYHRQPFVVSSGPVNLADVSPVVLADSTADAYKFCVVVIAGDCHASSLVGEIYINLPFVTQPNVYLTRFVANAQLRDISAAQITTFHHAAYQFGTATQDSTASTGRRITSAFSPYKMEDIFWNGKQIPNGSYAFWISGNLDLVRQEMLVAKIPPQPPVDTIARNTFVPVSITLNAISGLPKARARFGYAENNLSAAIPGYCTPRQVVCNTNGTPFVWSDESQTVQDCSTGCTVKVPAIPSRVVYYVIERSPDGVTWKPGATQMVAVN